MPFQQSNTCAVQAQQHMKSCRSRHIFRIVLRRENFTWLLLLIVAKVVGLRHGESTILGIETEVTYMRTLVKTMTCPSGRALKRRATAPVTADWIKAEGSG